jgi:hypothetical protein
MAQPAENVTAGHEHEHLKSRAAAARASQVPDTTAMLPLGMLAEICKEGTVALTQERCNTFRSEKSLNYSERTVVLSPFDRRAPPGCSFLFSRVLSAAEALAEH